MGRITKTEDERLKDMSNVLVEFLTCGVIGVALDRVHVSRDEHRHWLERYPKYKEKFNEIQERIVDKFEVEAMRRAMGSSDGLLTLMLKKHRKKVYGDRQDDGMESSEQIHITFNENLLTEKEKDLICGEGGKPQSEVIKEHQIMIEGGKDEDKNGE